jgi:hypothetical protein
VVVLRFVGDFYFVRFAFERMIIMMKHSSNLDSNVRGVRVGSYTLHRLVRFEKGDGYSHEIWLQSAHQDNR